MTDDNKGLIINGPHLTDLINKILSNVLINIDTDPISKHVVINKFKKVKDKLDTLEERVQERVFEMNLDTGSISFDIGEHMFKFISLNITLLFLNNTNESLNKEITLNIPKSIFHRFLSGNKALVEPYIISTSYLDVVEPIYYSIADYFDNKEFSNPRVLTINIPPEFTKKYDSIQVIVDTLATSFKMITLDGNLTLKQQLVNNTKINEMINLGKHNFIQDDGTIVRSAIVRNINLVSKEDMSNIIENNTGNPGDLSLVPVAIDESDRLLQIKFKIKTNNTTIRLSQNGNQSDSYKVNWGDNTLDSKTNHKFNIGEYVVKIYNRIDDMFITSTSEVEILEFTVPSGYRAPTEWNEPIISHPFTGGESTTVLFKAPSFPGGLFKYANKIIRINGLIRSSTITSVSETALAGLISTTVLDTYDLYKNVTSIGSKSFIDLINVRIFRAPFKDSAITSLPTTLLDTMESLEDITSFAENSKLENIPDNFGSVCYNLKVADYAFKNIPSLLNKNLTTQFTSFITDKSLLRSIKGMYDSTPIIINFNKNILENINNLHNIMDLSFIFKNTKVSNDDLVFTITNKENLETIESMFENVSTFNVNGPLLQECSSIINDPITISNSLKGTLLNFDAIDDSEIFVDTEVDGESGLEF